VSFQEAEEPLDALLAEFGPPTKTSAAYPFHHLTSDGLWVVTTKDGGGSPGSSLGALRSSGATGALDGAFAAALLADHQLLVNVAHDLLATNFPTTLHDDIAEQVGLDLTGPVPAGVKAKAKPKRSREFRDQVLLAYEMRCAMCGWDARLGALAVGLEAAHVRWFNIGGPDEPANGLCLCSLHHKLFDRGVLGLTPEHTVAVSAHFVGGGKLAQEFVLALVGKEIAEPIVGFPTIAEEHIAWHRTEVFRLPGRIAA
jgi:putative restriction endonuclease